MDLCSRLGSYSRAVRRTSDEIGTILPQLAGPHNYHCVGFEVTVEEPTNLWGCEGLRGKRHVKGDIADARIRDSIGSVCA